MRSEYYVTADAVASEIEEKLTTVEEALYHTERLRFFKGVQQRIWSLTLTHSSLFEKEGPKGNLKISGPTDEEIQKIEEVNVLGPEELKGLAEEEEHQEELMRLAEEYNLTT